MTVEEFESEAQNQMNGFEYELIKIEQLPAAWQSETALAKLQQFLQNSWKERTIFYSDGQDTSTQQFIDFERKNGIKLQNYIGTIGFQGEQLNIFPKLFQTNEYSNLNIPDSKSKTEGRDFDIETNLDGRLLTKNISFWLQYCDKMNVPFLSIRDSLCQKQDMWELLIAVYANYTSQLIQRQPYLQYETKNEVGGMIRGKIRETEYFQMNYPKALWHQIPYEYSAFTPDNLLNQIIKYTCQLLVKYTKEADNKKKLKEILWKLREVTYKVCNCYDCDKIALNIRHKSYQIVVDMSQMFLRNVSNATEHGWKESYCFLFPAELLFESFTSGFLRQCLPKTMRMKTQTNDQYLANLLIDGRNMGNVFGLREDILIETENDVMIIDTKYKQLPPFDQPNRYHSRRFGISDQDVRQIAIYAAKRNAKHVFLIYPLLWREKPTEKEIGYQIQIQENQSVYLEILKIPFLIETQEEKTKEELRKKLQKIFF